MAAVLRFLMVSSGPTAKEDYAILDKAAKKAEEEDIECEVLRDPDKISTLISSQTPTDDLAIYVCFPFEGAIYEKLHSKGFRIIGPQCVLSCLMLEVPVPHADHPICSIAMQDVVVCCSSMKRVDRELLHDLVSKMGGQFSKNFTSTVTHLIANEVGTPKYRVACDYDRPILLPDWVKDCWEKSRYQHIVATDSDILEKHKTPIFKGCKICVTGFNNAEREHFKEVVTKHGGSYSGELDMKSCTHLITRSPKGQKYTFAKLWKMNCVLPKWFDDCVEAGHWLDEVPYAVEPDSDTTQNDSMSLQQRGKVDETVRESMALPKAPLSSKAAQIAAKTAETFQRKSSEIDIASNVDSNSESLNIIPFDTTDLSITDFCISSNGEYFLDGCKIYLCNIVDPLQEICRKIINVGGGIRFSTMNENMTHIVVGDTVPSNLIPFLSALDQLPHVVSPKWLMQCGSEGKCLPEKDFSLLCMPQDKPGTAVNNTFAKPESKPAPRKNEPAVASSIHMNFEDDAIDDDNVFNQYLPDNESTRLSQADTSKRPSNEDQTTISEAMEERNRDETTALEQPTEMEETVKQVFAGLTFGTKRIEDVGEIDRIISQHGGSMSKSLKQCDYIITPLTHDKKIKIDAKEVTVAWIDQVLENETWIDPSACLLYKPIYLLPNNKILNNCMFTVSQYSGIERQHIIQLIELLDGSSQEFFVRKSNSKMKASTHLILQKPEGTKYEASLKWNIPCVSKNWLCQCALQGKRLSESEYPITDECQDENLEPVSVDGRDKEENTLTRAPTITSISRAPSISSVSKKNSISGNISSLTNDRTVTPAHTHSDRTARPSFDLSERGMSMIELSKAKDDAASLIEPQVNGDRLDNINDEDSLGNHVIGNGHTGSHSEEPIPVTIKSKLQLELGKSRYSFDFEDALASLQSPMGQSQGSRRQSRLSRGSRASLPFELQFEQALEKAQLNVPDHMKLPYVERDEKNSSETNDGILRDVVLVVSKKLVGRQLELHNLASDLGARCCFMYDESCTHFVHQGKATDIYKDLQDAKRDGKKIVSPYWLQACSSSNTVVDEMLYPPSYNPRMSLEVSDTRKQTSPTMPSKKHVTAPKEESIPTDEAPAIEDEDMEDNETEDAEEGVPELTKTKSLEERLGFQKKMEQIMEATKAPRNSRSGRRTKGSSTSSAKGGDDTSANAGIRKLRSRTSSQQKSSAESSRSSDPTTVQNEATSSKVAKQIDSSVMTEQSQNDVISYDDPTGRLERERILAQIRAASPSQDIAMYEFQAVQSVANNKEKRVTEDKESENHKPSTCKTPAEVPLKKKSMTPEHPVHDQVVSKPQAPEATVNLLCEENTDLEDTEKEVVDVSDRYRFIFSGLSPHEKIDYAALVERLGAKYLDAQYFNSNCTHVVSGNPSRSEKFLASVAAGKWVLHKSFLEASREANSFVDEEEHEWGSGANPSPIGASARRWRLDLTEKRKTTPNAGAFIGWVVLLCVEKSKQPGFKRLLEAGGAKVLAIRPPFQSIEGATHAFIADAKKAESSGVSLQELHDSGIWILRPDFISDYLIVFPTPSTIKYILPEAKTLSDEPATVMTPGKRKTTGNASSQRSKRSRR